MLESEENKREQFKEKKLKCIEKAQAKMDILLKWAATRVEKKLYPFSNKAACQAIIDALWREDSLEIIEEKLQGLTYLADLVENNLISLKLTAKESCIFLVSNQYFKLFFKILETNQSLIKLEIEDVAYYEVYDSFYNGSYNPLREALRHNRTIQCLIFSNFAIRPKECLDVINTLLLNPVITTFNISSPHLSGKGEEQSYIDDVIFCYSGGVLIEALSQVLNNESEKIKLLEKGILDRIAQLKISLKQTKILDSAQLMELSEFIVNSLTQDELISVIYSIDSSSKIIDKLGYRDFEVDILLQAINFYQQSSDLDKQASIKILLERIIYLKIPPHSEWALERLYALLHPSEKNWLFPLTSNKLTNSILKYPELFLTVRENASQIKEENKNQVLQLLKNLKIIPSKEEKISNENKDDLTKILNSNLISSLEKLLNEVKNTQNTHQTEQIEENVNKFSNI